MKDDTRWWELPVLLAAFLGGWVLMRLAPEVAWGLIGGGAFAWLSAHMAGNRNRDKVPWAVAGFMFGLIVPLVLLFVPKRPDGEVESE